MFAIFLFVFFFHNQVVRKLKPGQKIARCPRCGGNSIVYAASEPLPPSPSPQKMKAMLARRKGYSCPMPDTGHATIVTSTKPWKSFDERKKSDAIISEYAACAALACGYSFCTNCNCERHIDSVCPVRPISSSPTSDEDTIILRPSDRRSSRRNLRRLLNWWWNYNHQPILLITNKKTIHEPIWHIETI